LIDKKETIGAVVRTRTRVNPMFISPGHHISLATSIKFVLACGKGYRLPEPTRQADKLSKDNDWIEPSDPDDNQQLSLW
jgi:deoxyribonuclease V